MAGARRSRGSRICSGPKGSRGRSPALAFSSSPSSSAAPARSSLLPVPLRPLTPALTRQLQSPSLATPPGSPPARALPPLLHDEGRVSDLTEQPPPPPPPPPRGAGGMEPLSHQGLPRLSWIDTLYSSTCALRLGRPGSQLPGSSGTRGAGRGLRAPCARCAAGRECGEGRGVLCGGPQMGSPEPTSSGWVGGSGPMGPGGCVTSSHLLCNVGLFILSGTGKHPF